MTELTHRDIVRALFGHPGRNDTNADPRIDVLMTMVLDLLVEVEALRAAHVEARDGESAAEAYPIAYRDAAYLTHNSAGPSMGVEKLLARFYPAKATEDGGTRGQRTWRESLMLERLGFSDEQLRDYKRDAQRAEQFT